MVICSCCGVHPAEFYGLTLGEISVVVEGYNERERRETVSRLSAALRALGSVFGGNREPFSGLNKGADPQPISAQEARQLRFWRR